MYVWFQINRNVVNTIWFRVDLIRFLCVDAELLLFSQQRMWLIGCKKMPQIISTNHMSSSRNKSLFNLCGESVYYDGNLGRKFQKRSFKLGFDNFAISIWYDLYTRSLFDMLTINIFNSQIISYNDIFKYIFVYKKQF